MGSVPTGRPPSRPPNTSFRYPPKVSSLEWLRGGGIRKDDRLDVRPGADIYTFPWALSSESGSGESVHLGMRILTPLTLVGWVTTSESSLLYVFIFYLVFDSIEVPLAALLLTL